MSFPTLDGTIECSLFCEVDQNIPCGWFLMLLEMALKPPGVLTSATVLRCTLIMAMKQNIKNS